MARNFLEEAAGQSAFELSGCFPIDLRPIWDGALEPPRTEMLRRSDGEHLLYRGKLHYVKGAPEGGKTWLCLVAALETLRGGDRVVYLDFESDEFDITHRLRLLGAAREEVGRLDYVRVSGAITPAVLDGWDALFMGASLVVIDACTEAMAAQGLDINSNMDVAAWVGGVPQSAKTAGCAVVVVDHVVKDQEKRNSRYSIGAQHKLAGADVMLTVYTFEQFAPGRIGMAVVYVEKDRPAAIRRFAEPDKRAAIFVFNAEDEGHVEAFLTAPEARDAGPTRRMDEIVEHLRRDTEPIPRYKNEIATLVGGKKTTTLRAIEQLVQDGRLVQVDARGGHPRYVPAEEDEGGEV